MGSSLPSPKITDNFTGITELHKLFHNSVFNTAMSALSWLWSRRNDISFRHVLYMAKMTIKFYLTSCHLNEKNNNHLILPYIFLQIISQLIKKLYIVST